MTLMTNDLHGIPQNPGDPLQVLMWRFGLSRRIPTQWWPWGAISEPAWLQPPCHLLALPHFPVVQVYTTCNIYIYETIPFSWPNFSQKKLCKCHDQFVGQSATLFSIQPDAARVSGIAVWSRIGGMWRYSSFWPSVFCFDHWSYLFSREDKVEVSPTGPTVLFLGQSYEFLPVKSNYTGFAPTHLRYSLCPPISIPLYLGCWEKPWWRVFLF